MWHLVQVEDVKHNMRKCKADILLAWNIPWECPEPLSDSFALKLQAWSTHMCDCIELLPARILLEYFRTPAKPSSSKSLCWLSNVFLPLFTAFSCLFCCISDIRLWTAGTFSISFSAEFLLESSYVLHGTLRNDYNWPKTSCLQ